MKSLLLAIVATVSFSAFAQPNTSTEFRIEKRLERLNDLIQRDRAHRFLNENEKRDVLQNINAAIMIIKDDSTPNPPQNPPYNPPYTPPVQPAAACSWFDGASHGLSQRGWHSFRVISGVHFSLNFYGNSGTESQGNCLNDIIFNIESANYRNAVSYAASTTCACSWYDGESVGLVQRGWHMTYKVPMATGGAAVISSQYFGNNGNATQGECQRQLVVNNFVCPVR